MNSETALQLIDKYAIGVEGGPEILSDADLKSTPGTIPPERTGWAFKICVRVGSQNLTFVYQVDIENWQKSDDGAKTLYQHIARLTARFTLLSQLTSLNSPA